MAAELGAVTAAAVAAAAETAVAAKRKSKKWVQISVCTHFLCRLTGIVK